MPIFLLFLLGGGIVYAVTQFGGSKAVLSDDCTVSSLETMTTAELKVWVDEHFRPELDKAMSSEVKLKIDGKDYIVNSLSWIELGSYLFQQFAGPKCVSLTMDTEGNFIFPSVAARCLWAKMVLFSKIELYARTGDNAYEIGQYDVLSVAEACDAAVPKGLGQGSIPGASRPTAGLLLGADPAPLPVPGLMEGAPLPVPGLQEGQQLFHGISISGLQRRGMLDHARIAADANSGALDRVHILTGRVFR